jgi:hypothetical protein
MSTSPSEDEINRWHRYFAVECNNRAWDLAARDRSPDEDREMLDAAHAATWHWSKVGTELNAVRADMLLAHVHAFVGSPALAMHHAKRCHAYFLAHPAPPWEMALTHLVMAQAAHAVGDAATYSREYGLMQAAISRIEHGEDRDLVLQSVARIPAP